MYYNICIQYSKHKLHSKIMPLTKIIWNKIRLQVYFELEFTFTVYVVLSLTRSPFNDPYMVVCTVASSITGFPRKQYNGYFHGHNIFYVCICIFFFLRMLQNYIVIRWKTNLSATGVTHINMTGMVIENSVSYFIHKTLFLLYRRFPVSGSVETIKYSSWQYRFRSWIYEVCCEL